MTSARHAMSMEQIRSFLMKVMTTNLWRERAQHDRLSRKKAAPSSTVESEV